MNSQKLLNILQNVFACDNLQEAQKVLQNPRHKEAIKFLLNN